MIRRVEKWMGRDGTHQNMRERRLWTRDADFLGKIEGAVGRGGPRPMAAWATARGAGPFIF
jgi:hypothetical protein